MGPPDALALLSFASPEDVLTDGFNTLVPISLSIDTPEAGSTCKASSMRPDDGLQEGKGVRENHSNFSMQRRKLCKTYFAKKKKIKSASKGKPLPSSSLQLP